MASMTPALPNRAFGAMLVAVLVLVGLAGLWRVGHVYAWPLGLALGVSLPTALRPALLTPLTRAWLRLGELLHRVVSPVILGLLFFGMITPLALALRAGRRDALARRFEADKASYWLDRAQPGPDAASLSRQF